MAEGIGARLRGARERSRLTILQAAEKLHVDPDVLEALEADDFAALGAPVYVKGHLRHYAELVGEPVEALFDLYAQGTQVAPPDLTRIPKAPPDDSGRLVAPAVVVVIVFAVAGAAWWAASLSHRQWGNHAMPMPIQATAPAQPVEPAQPVQQAPAPAAASPAMATGPIPSAEASAIKVSKSSEAAAPANAAAPHQGEIEATFAYAADSWTEVYDANGRRLLYGLATGPATRRLEGVPPLSVTLGDARGVTVEVGGQQASISRFVRPDHTARFLITADGRALAPPPKKGG